MLCAVILLRLLELLSVFLDVTPKAAIPVVLWQNSMHCCCRATKQNVCFRHKATTKIRTKIAFATRQAFCHCCPVTKIKFWCCPVVKQTVSCGHMTISMSYCCHVAKRYFS